MSDSILDRRAHSTRWWFERLKLFSGLLLLLVFAQLNYQQSAYADPGLQSFYQQVQAELKESASEEVALEVGKNAHAGSTDVEWAAASVLHFQSPDFELWSKKRIQEHQDSLLQDAEPLLAVLRIDRLKIEAPVYNGTDEFVLNRGVGRIQGTARIDGAGNLGLAGHRDGFFRGLKDIQQGDVLHLQTIHGETPYRVDSIVIVDPKDVSVLAPTSAQTLTLVTCYPFYFVGSAPKRFIVQATAQPRIAMN